MLFDIRTIVGALLGCYAVVLIVTGSVADSAADEAKTGGVNVNLWSGVGMGVAALAFLVWVLLRPVQVHQRQEPPADDEAESS